jgi:hypothetical protein
MNCQSQVSQMVNQLWYQHLRKNSQGVCALKIRYGMSKCNATIVKYALEWWYVI